MQDNHEAELDALRRRHASELDQLSKQLEELKHKHTTDREATTNERVVFEQELGKMNEVLRSKEIEHDSITNQLKANHSSELSRLKETHATEFKELKEQHIAELNEVKNQLKETYSTFTTSASEKQAEHDSIINNLNNELASLKATHLNTINQLKRSNDMVEELKQTILELNTKVQDLELKLITAAKSESTTIAQMDEEMGKLRAALNDSQEKLTVLEQNDILHTEMYRRESEEREKELLTATREIDALRNELKVCISRIYLL